MGLTETVGTVLSSPTDIILLLVIGYLVFKIIRRRFQKDDVYTPEPRLPPMKRRDFTLDQLRYYDGSADDGRILMAVDGDVFDVTMSKHMYGKEGPYGLFAGRDASRGMATFSTSAESVRDTHDDLSDLAADELNSMKEWAQQFKEKYAVVGRLLKPGEEAQQYPEEESDEGKKDN